MSVRRIFRKIQPYLTAIVVVIIAAFLVSAIYFTELGKQWLTFLTGILIASVIAMASRTTRAEWALTRRTAQLKTLKDKLEHETQLRQQAEAGHQQALVLLQRTEQAFGRLIPHQLLKLLERESILDVQLGDQVERKLTIMFSDIRNFTALSEAMTPQENFNFLNSFLKQMSPVISTHRGIIDKYVGDSILALFTHSADDALAGAIHMLEKLDEYNAGRARAGYPAVQIGLGLNTGLVMIGTVGGAIRMESTVIGDAVNLTSRIEEATKTYQTPLLISQNTLYDLSSPGKYDIRFLDRIRVKGKTQPLSLYEVFDNDPVKLRDGKRASKNKFEQAIAHYHLKNIPQAIKLLEECIETAPKDVPARIYLSRCEKFLASGWHETTGELNTHISWRKEFQIGIKEIDASHTQLFNKYNEFVSASIAGDAKLIREIFAYFASHHTESESEEENMMRQYHYPFLESHLEEHKRFIAHFNALKEEVDESNGDMSHHIFRTQLLLLDWFTGHIAKSDRHAGRFLLNAIQPPQIPPKPFQ